jgi:hypothetical protein
MVLAIRLQLCIMPRFVLLLSILEQTLGGCAVKLRSCNILCAGQQSQAVPSDAFPQPLACISVVTWLTLVQVVMLPRNYRLYLPDVCFLISSKLTKKCGLSSWHGGAHLEIDAVHYSELLSDASM